ncbi:MAG: hypothetical protein PHF14_15100 [Verrucomicrobiota bacterium]|nr:hypothetical protein [Verrucomicrobiota bacterium]
MPSIPTPTPTPIWLALDLRIQPAHSDQTETVWLHTGPNVAPYPRLARRA